MRVVRWSAVIPLAIALLLVVLAWWLFLDGAVRRSVEYAGAEIVGARVDVADAHVALARGRATFHDLAVTNPGAPMTNLFEAREIVASLRLLPLLEKKIVIDTVAIRGVRFGTPRRTSGALAHKSPTAMRIAQMLSAWEDRIKVPPLSLRGLTSVVDVSKLDADSLRTLRQAKTIVAHGDSLQELWRGRLDALDPQPVIDSAQALAKRLDQADVRALGVAGVRSLVTSTRARISDVQQEVDRLKALEADVHAGVTDLRGQVEGLAAARREDYAYARRLVNLPSLEAPDLSPAIFGDLALQRLRPILYWLNLAEDYLPPGLDPRRQVGPDRLRASGTSVRFPREHAYPPFLLTLAEVQAEVGGTGVAAAQYLARLTGLTSAPTIYGRPTRFVARRSGAVSGPRAAGLDVVLDHVHPPARDSVIARLEGVALPTVSLAPVGARLSLQGGTTSLTLARTGDSLDARLAWASNEVQWQHLTDSTTGAAPAPAPAGARPGGAPIGSQAWLRDLLWQTVSRIRRVDIEVQATGSVRSPRLGVRSNIGGEIAQALRREVGEQIARAEQQVRARVDQLVQDQVTAAQAKAEQARAQVETQVAAKRAELEQAKADLEGKVRELTRGIPIPDRDASRGAASPQTGRVPRLVP